MTTENDHERLYRLREEWGRHRALGEADHVWLLAKAKAAIAPVSADPAGVAGQPVRVTYTNWRGETAEREIAPTGRVLFTSNEWHPEPQWLVEAHDARSGEVRLFALTGFGTAGQDVSGPGAVPVGWRLVPVEPTPEMVLAGHHQIDWCRNDQHTDDPSCRHDDGGTSCGEDIQDAWSAMLAATPTPPATAPGGLEADRAEQAARVMPLIGPLMDAWDGMSRDAKSTVWGMSPALSRYLDELKVEADRP